MVLDASAIIAILARDSDAQRYADAIDAAKTPLSVAPLTIVEAATGLARAKLHCDRPSTREEIVAAHSVVMAFLAANNVKEMLVGARSTPPPALRQSSGIPQTLISETARLC